MQGNRIYILLLLVLSIVISVNADTLNDLIKEGDRYSEETFANEKALKLYQQAEKLSPDNWEICWRISRAYIDIGEGLPAQTEEEQKIQMSKYNSSSYYGEKAVKLAPNQSVTLLRRALVNSRFAELKGFPGAIGLVKKVKEDLEKAIKIDNGGSNVLSFSHYVLGRVHMEVSQKPYLIRLPLGLGWADSDIAEAEYKKAIELRSNFREYFLHLGILYVSKDEFSKAKYYLAQLEKFPKQDKDDDYYLEAAKQILNSIKDKK